MASPEIRCRAIVMGNERFALVPSARSRVYHASACCMQNAGLVGHYEARPKSREGIWQNEESIHRPSAEFEAGSCDGSNVAPWHAGGGTRAAGYDIGR